MARGKDKSTQEEQVTDTAETESFTLEDEPTAPAEAEAAAPAAETKATRKKDELPEGWETPTAFAHRLTEELDGYSKESPFKPQQVYGYVKNGKDFPQKIHTDGRFIVEIAPALEWVKERQVKAAERKAKKAAADAAAAEAQETVSG